MRRVPFVRGTQKGVDHATYRVDVDDPSFPEPPDESLANPFGPLTLDDYLNWQWRIKTLTLTGTWTTNPSGPTSVFTFDPVLIPTNYRDSGGIITPAADEARRGANTFHSVGDGSGFSGGTPVAMTGTWTGTPAGTAFKLYIQTEPNTGPDSYYSGTQNFYMNFYFWLQVPSAVGIAGAGLFASSRRDPPRSASIPYIFPCAVSTLTVAGINIPLFRFQNSVENANQHLTINIDPTEWWPYENSLGQPVYDTATGAQINDPFA